jgi:hypothetical protein
MRMMEEVEVKLVVVEVIKHTCLINSTIILDSYITFIK